MNREEEPLIVRLWSDVLEELKEFNYFGSMKSVDFDMEAKPNHMLG